MKRRLDICEHGELKTIGSSEINPKNINDRKKYKVFISIMEIE